MPLFDCRGTACRALFCHPAERRACLERSRKEVSRRGGDASCSLPFHSSEFVLTCPEQSRGSMIEDVIFSDFSNHRRAVLVGGSKGLP